MFSGDLRQGRGLTTLKNEGFWYLQPTADGKQTRVLYYVHTNPGGKLPKSLLRFANKRGIPDVFRDIKKALAKCLGC